MLLASLLWLMSTAAAPAAQPEKEAPWAWQPSLVPKAILVEGLWTDTFRLREAVHAAGLPYAAAYKSASPYWQPSVRLFGIPAGEQEYGRFSVIVLSNIDAPTLTPERVAIIRRFVSNGGGLLVLGGYWAYSRGAYQGTPLEEMLPVTFPPENRIPPVRTGAVLHPAPAAQLPMDFQFASKPAAFLVQNLVPKQGARVELLAGDKPALVSGTYGSGRVVACALTPNGVSPEGVLAFWDWRDWPRLLGGAIDWAAGVRPLQVAAPIAASGKRTDALTEKELDDLSLGVPVDPSVVRRACLNPTRQIAEGLLGYVLSGEAKGVTLADIRAAVLPFAKPEWAARLKERAETLNPDAKDREAALVLMGASRSPDAYAVLIAARQQPAMQLAAMEGLGLLGNPEAAPALSRIFADAMASSESREQHGQLDPEAFGLVHGPVAAHASLALYRLGDLLRLGDENGVARLVGTYARIHLMHRILANAGKRRVLPTDVQGIENRKRIWEAAQRLDEVVEKLRREAGPVPASQASAFIATARRATDEAQVEWIVLAMEQSAKALPPQTWAPLADAQDGTIRRLAAALAASPR